MGLSLVPDIVRVEDVLAAALIEPEGTTLPRDAGASTSCPTCGAEQNLGEADARRDGDATLYDCKNGCQVIVVVATPGEEPWPGRGYRLGEHVIRNAADLSLRLCTGRLDIPASPAALMRHKPGQIP